MKSLFPVGLAVAFFSTDQLRAQDLIGAEQVIEKASAQQGKKGADMPDSQQALKGDLDDYRDSRLTLTPEAAADQWLALAKRLAKLGQSSYRGNREDGVSFSDLVAVLPPTAGWAHLEKTLAAEKAKGASEEVALLALRWFVHTLTGNVEARKTDYQLLVDKAAALSAKEPYLGSMMDALTQQMIAGSDDPAYIMKLLDAQLQRQTAITKTQKESYGENYVPSYYVPNLVTTVGEKDAETFLLKALTTYPGPITPREKRTTDLARLIATENIDKLAAAQWELTKSYDAQELYAGLLKRFGEPKNDHNFESARAYEVARLILAGKTEDAEKILAAPSPMRGNYPLSLPHDLFPHAVKAGKTDVLIQFFDTSLRANPALPYWNDYFAVSNLDKQPDKAIALMKEALSRKNLSPEATRSLRTDLAEALLASSQVDEGVAELIKLAKETNAERKEETIDPDENTLKIAKIGFLMNRPEWTKDGIALALQELETLKKTSTADPSPTRSANFANALATTLIEIGQAHQAEAVLTDILEWQSQRNASAPPSYFDNEANTSLASLVGIYTDAKRSADVVTLLDRAPWWTATDLSQIMDTSVARASLQDDYLADAAARALDDIGQKETALKITEARLAQSPSDDRAYEQLLRSAGVGALPILERLAAQHRFEERPLIWKAQLLLTEGKLPEAEEAARAAIAVDPSDGEKGPGDRMRAYAVLADIREARGDAKEAEFFRSVIKAIRLSEDADQLYKAGVIGPALAMYETSLTMFADAYCIQSRLALRMNEQGRWKEAEEHYRKAYELMPSSFGRVESHCFGCEGAFKGEKPQGVADQVFTKLAAEQPKNPQVHYLLGYLRETQDRPEEAMRAYQQATALDPDYFNAWSKMASLDDQILLTTDERNAIALNLTRLNPNAVSSSILSGVTDLGAIWTMLSEADKKFTPVPKELYPLKAAQKAIEAMKEDPAKNASYEEISRSLFSNRDRTRRPTTDFARAPFVEATGMLLENSSMIGRR